MLTAEAEAAQPLAFLAVATTSIKVSRVREKGGAVIVDIATEHYLLVMIVLSAPEQEVVISE